MSKIKNFFTNKITKIVAWSILVLAAAVLIIGGTTAESLSKGIVLAAGIMTAVGALVTFIISQIKK